MRNYIAYNRFYKHRFFTFIIVLRYLTWNGEFLSSVRTHCRERHRYQSLQEAGSSTWHPVPYLWPNKTQLYNILADSAKKLHTRSLSYLRVRIMTNHRRLLYSVSQKLKKNNLLFILL